ncbi:uncharacterized protein A1O9_09529 [Exophiala aquamarina CBS 119918]|uniref:Xylanolytic transcriptional activator regulatory domain-containing protein n=1 Tax=Exophiala aquamarina CBS 119918 TaxID=1182545 RepID=A0A072P523_9EURO|nr:uncharacterized protein A1O9_09529 [Exophiala aquamarina CBS 119918]KEF54363.1 hypothetical protein A1O9_09529 [Exophiala aquamarina CBS 119918]
MIKSSASGGFATAVVDQLVAAITPPFLGLSATVPLARCVVAGTRLPSAKETTGIMNDIHENHPRSIINPQSTSRPLPSIPVHVANYLFNNYVTRVSPQYPIHYIPDLVAMHDAVFHQTGPDRNSRIPVTPYEVYTLNLIMAISLSTAARSNQSQADSIARGLFENAMEQMPGVLTNDLRGLQALTLLTQYAFLNPSVANFWLLTGFISQACIDLGLHQELPDHAAKISVLERDLRRRVFWSAWEMEIAVSGALLRPINLQRRSITTEFPSQVEDAAITPAGIDSNGRVTKFSSHYIWRYREIECDIVPILFHNEPIPQEFATLEGWMSHQERAILDWKAEIHDGAARNTDPLSQSQWDEMKHYSGIACDYILVTLFRPCPRIKEPTVENFLKAFSAAVGVADGSWEQANLDFGNSKYVFHSCYHSFSAAIVFLQALQRIKIEIAATYTLKQIEMKINAFSRFFATLAERWPAASGCLEEYERLLVPARKEFSDYLVQEAHRLSDQDSSITQLADGAGIYSNYDLGEEFTFGTIFNFPAPDVDRTLDYCSYIPVDWDQEFNFAVDKSI